MGFGIFVGQGADDTAILHFFDHPLFSLDHTKRQILSCAKAVLPCSSQPAGDASNVQNGKIAEEEFVEVKVLEVGLKGLMRSRALEG